MLHSSSSGSTIHSIPRINGEIDIATREYSDEALVHRADSYASFAATAALVFGFSMAVLWDGMGDSAAKVNSVGYSVMSAFMACSVATSGYSLTVHSIQHYVLLTLLASPKYTLEHKRQWIKTTSSVRTVGRYCLWLSLGFFMVSTVMYVASKLPRHDSLICGTILGLSTVAIFFTVIFMRPGVVLQGVDATPSILSAHETTKKKSL